MHLAHDYIYPYKGGVGQSSQCRIRIYLPDEERDAPVVICSELANNRGTAITNAAQWIAGDVIRLHGLSVPIVWIEHYPPETGKEKVDLVLFSHYDVRDIMRGGIWRREIGEPTWKPLDRATVEVLVGQPV